MESPGQLSLTVLVQWPGESTVMEVYSTPPTQPAASLYTQAAMAVKTKPKTRYKTGNRIMNPNPNLGPGIGAKAKLITIKTTMIYLFQV